MEIIVRVPNRRQILESPITLSPDETGASALFKICKKFELDQYSNLEKTHLIKSPTMDIDGVLIPKDANLKDYVRNNDVVEIYEFPGVVKIEISEELSTSFFSHLREMLLDLARPLRSICYCVRDFDVRVKPSQDYGFMIVNNKTAEVVWCNDNMSLMSYAFDVEDCVLCMSPVSAFKGAKKLILQGHHSIPVASYEGMLDRRFHDKWVEREIGKAPEDEEAGLGKLSTRFFSYISPMLMEYKNINDTTAHDIIPLDSYILKMQKDRDKPVLISLTRAYKPQGVKKLLQKDPRKYKYVLTSEDPEILAVWYSKLKNDCMNTSHTKVFGASLNDLMQPNSRKERSVPAIMFKTINYLDTYGLQEEGLFRKNGSHWMIDSYVDLFDIGEDPDFEGLDVHVVAGLLKLFLRMMPEPLLTYDLYDRYIAVCEADLNKQDKIDEWIRLTINELPDINFTATKFLLQFLTRMNAFSEINLMHLGNLATVFGPNLLKSSEDLDPFTYMQKTPLVNEIVESLIENEARIIKENFLPPPKPSFFFSPKTRSSSTRGNGFVMGNKSKDITSSQRIMVEKPERKVKTVSEANEEAVDLLEQQVQLLTEKINNEKETRIKLETKLQELILRVESLETNYSID